MATLDKQIEEARQEAYSPPDDFCPYWEECEWYLTTGECDDTCKGV